MKTKYGFARYDLPDQTHAALKALGFRRPTRVQEKVIPMFLQEFNLIVEAPTGTGKTAAYGLPLMSKLNLQKGKTQALVMLPSRELALQALEALRSFYDGPEVKVDAVYGGTSMEESYAAIKREPHILIVVPGRLKDVMSHYQYDYLWRDIKYLIVDEGDKMIEPGFARDFDAIRTKVRKTVQVGFFSATISSLSEELIRERFPHIKTVRLSPREMLRNIHFQAVPTGGGQREAYLAGLIKTEKIGKALIFCARREDIYATTGFLRNCGFKAEAYYGDMGQQERRNILDRFKADHIDYLVASDLAARGLDIEALPAVVNLSIPDDFEHYLHRVGRTGRAGLRGSVYNILLGQVEHIRLERHHEQIGLPIKELRIAPAEVKALQVAEEEKWVKYLISRGQRDKIRKGDIAGFLVNQAGLDPTEVGTITIFDAYTVVDMPQRGFLNLADRDDLRLKGRTLKIRKYQLEEQQRKDDASKRLKADRR
jgi:ATP-independent RNA helicase DbpA